MAIDINLLREHVDYNPETGRFRHKKKKPGITIGDFADTVRLKHGYAVVVVQKKPHLAHRLAWAFVHGRWPIDVIDHIDGDKANNSIGNLREATTSQNGFASRKTRRGENRGIVQVGNRWRAYIGKDRKYIHLGYFDCREEAKEAHSTAALKLYGAFAETLIAEGAL